MNSINRPIRLALTLLTLFAAAGVVRADEPAGSPAQPPRKIIEKLVADGLVILRDSKLSADEKTAKIQQLAFERIDFATISRLTLGRHWRTMNDAQQADFMKEYRQHLSLTYANIGREYKNQDVQVAGDHALERGDWMVESRVIGDNNAAIKVEYRLRQKDGQWWIIDLQVEGQSLVLNFRSQFDDILKRGGIETLLKTLHEKNAAAKK